MSTPEEKIKPTGFWYCQNCNIRVQPDEVTHGERHDDRCGGCGSEVEWRYKEPPEMFTLAQIEGWLLRDMSDMTAYERGSAQLFMAHMRSEKDGLAAYTKGELKNGRI